MARNLLTGRTLKSVKWTGLREAIDAADKISGALDAEQAGVGAQAMKKVYMRAAQQLVREAYDLAPYDPHRDPRKRGTHLRDAIFAAYGKASEPNVIVGVNSKKAPHGHLLEFGTVNMKARPFMRPALAAARPLMLKTVQEGAEQVIKDLVDRYGAK